MSYIHPDDAVTLTAILFALAWLGFVVDNSRLGKSVPGVPCILVLGLLLSNFHITPFDSGASRFIGENVVAAAIPLLMIKADLKRIFVESGRVMLGFAAACVGVVTGVIVGYLLLKPWQVPASIAGVYAGAFIGGTISMVAVANALRLTASELASVTGASMIPSVLGLMALVSLPTLRIVRRLLPEPRADHTEGVAPNAAVAAPPAFRLTHIAGALALSFSICALARGLAQLAGHLTGHDQGPYTILYVTALTVLIANLVPRLLQRLEGEFDLGMLLMYLFFGVIGLGTNIVSFLDNALSLFFYVIILLAIGIIVSLLLSRALKLDLAEAVTGCGAAIVGPAATVAVVAGKGWHSMVSPAVMTGIFCHIVGNFVGVSVAALLR